MNKKRYLEICFSFFIILGLSSASIKNSFILKNMNLFNYKYQRNINLRHLDNNKKNLILGTITEPSWEKIKFFFLSLIKVDLKNCDVVIYSGDIPPEINDKLKSFNITILRIPDEYLKSTIHINKYLWKLYEDYLLANKDKYNMVFTSELKSTFFQQNIFQFYENNNKPFLGLFLEDGTLREPVNHDWLLTLLKEKEYDAIADKPIICIGGLIGSIDSFIEISHNIWETTKNISQSSAQGALNFLIYFKKIIKDDMLIIKDNHGPLMNLGLTKNDINIDKDGNILNLDGKIAAIVRQYEKKKNIVDNINLKFKENDINEPGIIIANNDINNESKKEEESGNRNIYLNFLILSFIIVIIINFIVCSVKLLVERKKSTQITNKRFRKVKIMIKTNLD